MVDDILRIKIYCDLMKCMNFMKSASGFTKNMRTHLLSKYDKRYVNLLMLVNNMVLRSQSYSNSSSYSELLYLTLEVSDMDFLSKLCLQRNIEIVEAPRFIKWHFDKNSNSIGSESVSVSSLKINTLEHIKNSRYRFFHIYLILKNFARWYECDNEDIKVIRMQKLEKINSL